MAAQVRFFPHDERGQELLDELEDQAARQVSGLAASMSAARSARGKDTLVLDDRLVEGLGSAIGLMRDDCAMVFCRLAPQSVIWPH